MEIAGEIGNLPSKVADWPHCCDFRGDTCDDLRWFAMLLEAQNRPFIVACGRVYTYIQQSCQKCYFNLWGLQTPQTTPSNRFELSSEANINIQIFSFTSLTVAINILCLHNRHHFIRFTNDRLFIYIYHNFNYLDATLKGLLGYFWVLP